MDKNKYLTIRCNTCSDIYEDQEVFFQISHQYDDNVVMKCPSCGLEISYDDIEGSKIQIFDWLYKTDRILYNRIIREYFAPLLESID